MTTPQTLLPRRSWQRCLRQLTPLLAPISNCRAQFQHRTYYSYEHEPSSPFTAAESSILSAALTHVPAYGFTDSALRHGARDAGYLDVSTNLFPRGPFDLISYHLITQRLALGMGLQFPGPALGVGAKVKALALQRLRANGAIIHRWQEVRWEGAMLSYHAKSCWTLLFFVSRVIKLPFLDMTTIHAAIFCLMRIEVHAGNRADRRNSCVQYT